MNFAFILLIGKMTFVDIIMIILTRFSTVKRLKTVSNQDLFTFSTEFSTIYYVNGCKKIAAQLSLFNVKTKWVDHLTWV